MHVTSNLFGTPALGIFQQAGSFIRHFGGKQRVLLGRKALLARKRRDLEKQIKSEGREKSQATSGEEWPLPARYGRVPKTDQPAEKRKKLGQISSASKNLSVIEGLIIKSYLSIYWSNTAFMW